LIAPAKNKCEIETLHEMIQEVSGFYNWSRDYWIALGSLPNGTSSGMLNFGLWDRETTTLYDAQENLRREVVYHLPPLADDAIGLEIGCGIGGGAVRLAQERSVRLACLDLVAEQLEFSRQRAHHHGLGDRIEFARGSSMAMPFDDARFDFSYCIESSFHYPDKAAFLNENFRVLKPGATTLIADITCSDNSRVGFRRGNHYCSVTEMTAWMLKAGFTEVRVVRLGDRVFRPLHAFAEAFSHKRRDKLQKYWGLVLGNYERLWAEDVMGYDLFIGRR
jgi:cyclopropane fatty-acyl-phospholipid synthase-like methyltransferase